MRHGRIQTASREKRLRPRQRMRSHLRASSPASPQCKCACGGGCPRCQEKTPLPITSPGDQEEQEADRIAAAVTGSPALAQLSPNSSGPATASVEPPSTAGHPLPEPDRDFFERKLDADFSDVRIHTGSAAADSAESLDALAYTLGNDVVFNAGQYRPDTDEGRRLLAHELVHVVQQSSGRKLRRQTIHASCAGHEAEIREAWSQAERITGATIRTLERIRDMMPDDPGPRSRDPRATGCIETAFGDLGFGGGVTFIFGMPTLIDNFRRIQGGFSGGKTIRCDIATIPNNDCAWRSAFVVVGNSTDIFLCPNFFEPDVSPAKRGVTLIHEMAHSVLRAGHEGIPERTYPSTFFDYSIPLGLDFDDAKKNAFAYEILADCLHGEPPNPEVEMEPPAEARAEEAAEYPWMLGLAGGISLEPESGSPDELQGLASIAGRFSFRPGTTVIFNPYIGLHALYSPTTEDTPAGFFSGVAEAGLRIQQPGHGFYFDISGGGYAGFEAPLDESIRPTGGLTGAVGLGGRWERIEIGPEVRLLEPLTGEEADPRRVLILTRFAAHF